MRDTLSIREKIYLGGGVYNNEWWNYDTTSSIVYIGINYHKVVYTSSATLEAMTAASPAEFTLPENGIKVCTQLVKTKCAVQNVSGVCFSLAFDDVSSFKQFQRENIQYSKCASKYLFCVNIYIQDGNLEYTQYIGLRLGLGVKLRPDILYTVSMI